MTAPASDPVRVDIAIAGGGLVGLTLALALDQAGLEVAVVDALSPQTTLAPHFDGRAFAIAFASFRMWRALGLGDALEPVAQPIERIMVTDGRPMAGVRPGGPALAHLFFDREEIAPGPAGEPLGYMLENRHIRLAQDEAVRARPRIKVLAPVGVADFAVDPTGVDVRLADGRSLRASLLVGADGRNSTVRAKARIRTIGRAYPVTAIVCTVAHERPHEGVAHEFFLPAGPFAILPLTKNRANVVWMEAHAVAQTLLAMPQPAFLAELKRRFGDFLGEVRLEGPRFGYPLSLQMAERMIGPRLALVGDAAHGVHPIAGQGLNLGLKDVAALADVLADAASRGLDPGDREVLAAYQAWRRFDNAAMAIATDFFDRLFSNDLASVRLIRGAGLALVNRIGPARRFFMRYAGGGAGRLPRLMREEAR